MNIKCAYTELVPIEDINLNPKNRNKHSDAQIERLSCLIDHYGVRHPIIISGLDNSCVAGEGRFLAMKKLGFEKVPVDFQQFKDHDEQQSFGIADNAIADWGELDLAGINEDMLDMGPDLDILLLGLERWELDLNEKEPTEKKKKEITCPECGALFGN